jgi:hypothetical protein
VPGYAKGASTGPNTPLPSGQSQAGSNGKSTGLNKKGSALNRLTHGQPGVAGAAAATSGAGLWLAIGIPVLVVLLLTWPALTRLLTRRRRWLTAAGNAGQAQAAWRELTDDLVDLGLQGAPGETPRGVGRRITERAGLDPPATEALTRIVTAEEQARYARLALPAPGLAADVRTVRRAAAASVRRGQRLRARLLPASTLTASRRLLERLGALLSWLDSSWPALRQQLRRARAQRSA